MDKQQECQSCKTLHRKIRVYHPPKKHNVNLSYAEKILGKVNASWFDELSQARIKQDEKKEIKGYGKVTIQTELSSLTPSTRDSNKSLYASTPGHGELTPLSAWARINSEESEISSPITLLITDTNKSYDKDKAVPSLVRDLINEELDMTWTSSMATPKLNTDVQSSQESTFTEKLTSINKIKGLPRVLFSPGPGGLSVNEELGFSLNTTVDDNTIINVKEDSVCEPAGSSQDSSIFHPALLELGCNAFDPSPSSLVKKGCKVSEMTDKNQQEAKWESPENDSTVLSALSDFFDTPKAFEKRKKVSRSRKRKLSCLGIAQNTPDNSSVSQSSLTPSSILKSKRRKTDTKCKRVRFGETFFSSDKTVVQDTTRTVIKDQLSDLIDLVVMSESNSKLLSSPQTLTLNQKVSSTKQRTSSTSSSPVQSDYLFSQISPSSLKTMCELAEAKKFKVDLELNEKDLDRNKAQSENKLLNENDVLSKNKLLNENDVLSKNKLLNENDVLSKNKLLNENDVLSKNKLLNENDVLSKNKLLNENDELNENKLLNENYVLNENKLLNENYVLNENKLLNENDVRNENKLLNKNDVRNENKMLTQNKVLNENKVQKEILDIEPYQNKVLNQSFKKMWNENKVCVLKDGNQVRLMNTSIGPQVDHQNKKSSKDNAMLKAAVNMKLSVDDLNVSTSSETDSQSSRGSQENKLSLKPRAQRFLYPSLNQITKSSPKSVYGFKRSTSLIKSTLCALSPVTVKSETMNEVNSMDTSVTKFRPVLKLEIKEENVEARNPAEICSNQASDVSPENKSTALSQRTKNAVDDIVNNLDSQFFDEDMDTTPTKSSQTTQDEATSSESSLRKSGSIIRTVSSSASTTNVASSSASLIIKEYSSGSTILNTSTIHRALLSESTVQKALSSTTENNKASSLSTNKLKTKYEEERDAEITNAFITSYELPGFATAGGKTLQMNMKSLSRAEQLLSVDNLESRKEGDDSNVSANSSFIQIDGQVSFKRKSLKADNSQHHRASSIEIDNTSYTDNKETGDDDLESILSDMVIIKKKNQELKQMCNQSISLTYKAESTHPNHPNTNGEDQNDKEFALSDLICSKSRNKKSNEDCDIDNSKLETKHLGGFSTASGFKINVSSTKSTNSIISDFTKELSQDFEPNSKFSVRSKSFPISPTTGGFSTASGSKIAVNPMKTPNSIISDFTKELSQDFGPSSKVSDQSNSLHITPIAGGFSTASGSKITLDPMKTPNSIISDFTKELSQDFESTSKSNSLPVNHATDDVKVDIPKITLKRHNGFNPFKKPRMIKKVPDICTKAARTEVNVSKNVPKYREDSGLITTSTELKDESATDIPKTFLCSVSDAKISVSQNTSIDSDDDDCFDTQMSEIMMTELEYVSSKHGRDAEDKPYPHNQHQTSKESLQNKSKVHPINPVTIMNSLEKTQIDSQEESQKSNLEENVKVFFKMSKLSKQIKERNSQNSQEFETYTPLFISGSAIKPIKPTQKIFLSEETVNKDQLKSKFPQFKTASGRKAALTESSLKAAQDLFKEESQSNKPKFPMFKTALGKDVTIKDESLKTAKNLFDEGCVSKEFHVSNGLQESSTFQSPMFQTSSAEQVPVNYSVNCVDYVEIASGLSNRISCGFQTASGQKVHVSDRALHHVKSLLEDEVSEFETESIMLNVKTSIPSSTSKFPMFATASGKKVEVKEKSLQHIKEALDFDCMPSESLNEDEQKVPNIENSDSKSNTVLPNIPKMVSNSKLPNDQPPVIRDMFCGFQTASGHKSAVNPSSILHAKQDLLEKSSEFSESVVPVETKQYINDDSASKDIPANENVPDISMRYGFQTASGKGVNVSAQSLKQVQDLLREKSTSDGKAIDCILDASSDCQMSFSSETSVDEKHETKLSHLAESFPENDTSEMHSNLFQTASGKGITVDDASLKHVKDIFKDETSPNKSTNLFQTASGKGITVDNASLKHVKDIFKDETSPNKSTNLFQTASGKGITVDNASLKHVKDIFKDETSPNKSTNLFQTASGKGITVDNASLKHVKDIFKDETSPNKSTNFYQTASGKGITVDNASLKHVKDIFKDETSPNKSTNLFQTASGKGITVDDASLKHVQDKFKDETSPNKSTDLFKRGAEKHAEVISASYQHAHNVFKDVSKNNNNALSVFDENCPRPQFVPKNKSLVKVSKPIKPCFVTPDKRKPVPPQSAPSSSDAALCPKSGLLEDRLNKKYKPIYSYPEQHYLDKGSRHHPILANSIEIRKTTYKDQLNSLLGQQKSSEKSRFQTPYRKTESASTSKPEENSHSVKKSTPFLAKRSLKLGATPVKPDSNEKETSAVECPSSSETKEVEVDSEVLMCHLVEARMKQEKIIRYKKKRKIRPLAGQLSTLKRERTSSMKYEELNRESLTTQELLRLGCLESTLKVRPLTALEHRFQLSDFYPGSLNKDILVGDGAVLIPDDHGFSGKEEFFKSFETMEGVDLSLISIEWFDNHYRWIVWKLAAYEVAFPRDFIRRSLTPNNVMLQLKYRYDKEIDQCFRSCIKKIVERDDTACKRLVLCVSDIKQRDQDTEVELTDGWYCIKASLDTPLLDLVHKKHLVIGQKVVTTGAELVGSQEACSPLEIPESLQLKLCYNSTRPVSWHSRLGYQHDPRPLIVPLTSLHSTGGMIGTIDIVVVRIYPILYMEKLADGGCIFRSAEIEESISRKHEQRKQVMIEKLYSKLQSDLEKSDSKEKKSRRNNQRWKKEDIEQLTTGQEILEAVECSLQPEDIQSLLSERQVDLMREYQQKQHDNKQQQLHSEIQQTLADNQQMNVDRKVTPLLKIRVCGCCKTDIDNSSTTILTIWRPSSEWLQMQEGKRYKLYNLLASSSRSRLESLPVSLTACRNTRIKYLPIDENFLDVIYEPREVWSIADLKVRRPPHKEFDFVGMVFDVENGRQGNMQTVHCIDIDGGFLNITFWTGLKNFGFEDILGPGKCFVACNLILKSSYSETVISDVLQEVTQISNTSKAPQHKKYLDRFHSIKQDRRIKLLEDARGRYKERLNNTITKTPQKRYNDVPFDVEELLSPMDVGNTSINSASDISPEEQAVRKRKSIQKAKTAKLLAYGSPSALSPINYAVSPAVFQEFKTPIRNKKPRQR